MLSLSEIAPNELTSKLLFANGVLDARIDRSMHDGWREVATSLGFDVYARTPAYERYCDGWYSVPADERKKESA